MFITGIKPDAAATDTAEFTPGTIGAIFDGSLKVYKYVLYDKGTADVDGVAGEVAYYVADTGYNAHTVTSDLSDSSEVGAGVLQVNAGDQYCWIQIKGPATLTIALTAGADGDPLTATGASDGTLDVTTASTDPIVAWASDASEKEIICDFPW